MAQATLWGDAFAPVTSAIGFLEAPHEDVVEALLAWRARLHGSAERQALEGGLRDNLRTLEPLMGAVRPRELVVATRNPAWTALLDCGLSGSDPISTVAYLARTMQVQGVAINSIPDRRAGSGLPDRFGARQLELFAPIATQTRNSVRAISLVRDGARWRLDLVGTPQLFEDLKAYEQRKVTDRFTEEMLVQYAAALGLEPFEDDFYPGPCELVTNPAVPPPGARALNIEGARLFFGIDAA